LKYPGTGKDLFAYQSIFFNGISTLWPTILPDKHELLVILFDVNNEL